MPDTNPLEQITPPVNSSNVVTLWTPKNIFWLGVFLGWPSALVLCIINWFRMGLWKKAFIFTGVGMVALILYIIAMLKLPEGTNRYPLLAIQIFLLVCFQALMNLDFLSFGYPNEHYRQASIGRGILIGILTLVLLVASVFVASIFIEVVKAIMNPAQAIPLPGMNG